mmetsp:Transcript_69445/g.194754  ORF Transcript_69445/g.194754 Transcript_69445/m.194754 type:complete len:653 (+) Transcript_69445:132-2090(+)
MQSKALSQQLHCGIPRTPMARAQKTRHGTIGANRQGDASRNHPRAIQAISREERLRISGKIASQAEVADAASAPELGDNPAFLLQGVDEVSPAFQQLCQRVENAVAHGGGAADVDHAGALLDPMLHRLGLRTDLVLHVLALLALARSGESREETCEGPLRADLHPVQRRAPCGCELHSATHLLLEEPVLLRVAAAEEERGRSGLRTSLQLLPEATEGGDAGSRAHHDHRDVLLGKVQRRRPLLRQHHGAGLEPGGEPPAASAVEAAPARGQLSGGQATRVDEALARGGHVRELVAREAHAQGDLRGRGLRRGGDGELPRLLPGAVQQELHGGDGLDAEHGPELAHPAAQLRSLQQLQRLRVRDQLPDALPRSRILDLRLQRHQHLLRRRAGQVAVLGQGVPQGARRGEGMLDGGAWRVLRCRLQGDPHAQVRRRQAHELHRGLHVGGVVLRQQAQRAAQLVLLQIPLGLDLHLHRGEALLRLGLLPQLPDLRHLGPAGLEVEARENIRRISGSLLRQPVLLRRHLQLHRARDLADDWVRRDRRTSGRPCGRLYGRGRSSGLLAEALAEVGADLRELLGLCVLQVDAGTRDADSPDLRQRLGDGRRGRLQLVEDGASGGPLTRVAVVGVGDGQEGEAQRPQRGPQRQRRIADL